MDNKIDKNGLKAELSLYPNIQGKATLIKYQNNVIFAYIKGITKNNNQRFTDYVTSIATIPSGFISENYFSIPFSNIGWYSADNILIETAHIQYSGTLITVIKPKSEYSVKLNGNFFYQCN